MAALMETGWTVFVGSVICLASALRSRRLEGRQRLHSNRLPNKHGILLRQSSSQSSCDATNAHGTQELARCLKKCLETRSFNEGLSIYDRFADNIGEGSKRVWSLLLYFAVKADEFHRCDNFILALLEVGDLTGNDFVNIVRHYANSRDAAGLTKQLNTLRQRAYEPDLGCRNRALNVCAAAGSVSLAEALIQGTSTVRLDVAAYNTLIRLYANCEQVARCQELVAEMKEECLKPDHVTFSMLIQIYCKSGNMDSAVGALVELSGSGRKPNKMQYMPVMMGLIRAQRADEAERLLFGMAMDYASALDERTCGCILSAYAEVGAAEPGIRLLTMMLKQGRKPDVALFNTVLNACSAKSMEPFEIVRVFEGLVEVGLRPNTASLSALIEALVQANGYDEALALLRDFPSHFLVYPATGVFKQFVCACQAAGRLWEADQAEALEWAQLRCDAPPGEAWPSTQCAWHQRVPISASGETRCAP